MSEVIGRGGDLAPEVGDRGVPVPAQAPVDATYPWLRGRPRRCRLRGDGTAAQFARFVLVGGSSNIVYALVFLVLRGQGSLLANVAGVALSTVLANELHRRLTFNAAERVDWLPAQWEAGGLALVGLALSTSALALLGLWFPSAPGVVQAILVVAVSALVGVFRFLALRGWVFAVAR